MIDINRRAALRVSLGGSVAAYALSQMPMLATAATISETKATDDFIWLSAKLIHVKMDMIAQTAPSDGIRLCDLFYSILKDATAADAFAKFEGAIKSLKKDQPLPVDLLGKSRKPGTSEIAWASRMTMMMWLFGLWYGKTEIDRMRPTDAANAKHPTGDYFSDEKYKNYYVISSRAYANGWIWRVAQAHAMGVSQFSFGSWADIPPYLADYGFESL